MNERTKKPKRGDAVTNGRVRYRVERAHRDGSLTIRAIFFLDAGGGDRPGYLGDLFHRVDPTKVRKLAREYRCFALFTPEKTS